MKLSLCILQEWLAQFQPRLETYRDCSKQRCSLDCICIENIQLYNGQEESLANDRSTLFVGRHCDFFPGEGQNVVCRYTESTLFLETQDLFSVFNEILNAFRHYEKWCNELQHLIDQHGTLSELLDISDPIIGNPMFVFDSSDSIIAYSSKYEEEEIDDHWRFLMEQKHSPEEVAFPFHDRKNAYFDQMNHEPYILSAGIVPRTTCSQNLFYNQEWCGLCSVIEYSTPFCVGKNHLFKILCNYIQLWIDKQTSDALFHKDASRFMELLEGKETDQYFLQHRLQILGWEGTDTILLLYAGSISSTFSTQNYLCRIFSRITPFVYPVSYESSIVMLCNCSKLAKDVLLDTLSPWLKRGSYHCGMSRPFTSFDDIPAAFRQAKTAFIYGERQNKKMSATYPKQSASLPEEFHDIQDYMLFSILDQLRSVADASSIHPKVTELLEYDRQHASSYAQTLLVYLENERNIKETAALLNIHRNTLLQRIQRFTNHFQINLDTPQERLYLLLSLHLQFRINQLL